ncbi:MAG: copper chaperone PCu(A)C [Pseudomonadota bacterium]
MRQLVLAGALIVVTGFTGTAVAGSEDVIVEDAWSRASIGVNRPGVAYMIVRNTGDERVTLTGIATSLAKMPELHKSSINAEGVASMAPAGEIEIAPGRTIALEPGGLHAMLRGLQKPMAKGETFPLTLVFSDGGKVTVDVPILGIGARGPKG